jgi:hypothetical protein
MKKPRAKKLKATLGGDADSLAYAEPPCPGIVAAKQLIELTGLHPYQINGRILAHCYEGELQVHHSRTIARDKDDALVALAAVIAHRLKGGVQK